MALTPLPGDDVATVLGWLDRCAASRPAAEELTVEVFRQRALPLPDCLARAPEPVVLRHLAVRTVLRSRGVI